jgi:hypothetical protein
MTSWAVTDGRAPQARVETWLTELADRARRGLFYLTVTMTAAVGRTPS